MTKNFITVIVFSCLMIGCGTTVDDLGGKGESCFPNHTCNSPHTCFQVAENELCYTEVKPVMPAGAKICYSYVMPESNMDGGVTLESAEKTRCFDSNDDCITSFSDLMKTNAAVTKGCAFN